MTAGGRVVAFMAVALSVTIMPAAPSAAGPIAVAAAVAKPDPATELARLEKRATALNKEYRGELIELDEAKNAAERAARSARKARTELAVAQTDVRGIAAMSYMHGSMEAMPIVVADDPGSAMRDAAIVQHLARRNGDRVADLRRLRGEAAAARRSADAQLGRVRKVITNLEKQRTRVRVLLAKYQPQSPGPVSGRPDGGGGTGRSPLVGDYMTARMRALYLAVDGKFGAFPAIGCHRSGDPLDHGSGRACDFMESTGGRMPSAGAQAHGDQVAQFAIGNASKYGVKYVIWRQRIYDMRSPGWRGMEDRGSVTANHYDHVHISVF
jgi:exonuclease VII small subunit